MSPRCNDPGGTDFKTLCSWLNWGNDCLPLFFHVSFVSPARHQRRPQTELLLLLAARKRHRMARKATQFVDVIWEHCVRMDQGMGLSRGGCLGIHVFSKDIYFFPKATLWSPFLQLSQLLQSKQYFCKMTQKSPMKILSVIYQIILEMAQIQTTWRHIKLSTSDLLNV